jgi:hypothetical protein
MCCSLPAHQALEARLKPAQTYRAVRAIDQSKQQYELEEKQRLQERATHRFAKCYTPVTFFFITLCGIVLSFAAQYSEESHVDVLSLFLLTYPTVASRPAYWFFDSQCSVHRAISPAGVHSGIAWAAGRLHGRFGSILLYTAMLVDRFHFHGHHKGDRWCCIFCNPYALGLTGIVEIVRRTPIVPSAPSADPEENGSIGRKFAVRDPVTRRVVEHRRIIRQLDAAGLMWENEVVDHGNTPTCEQAFVHFGGFKAQCKTMRACWARLYVKFMRDAWNSARTAALAREGLNPRPSPAAFMPAPPPPRWWQLALFGDSNC